MMGEVQKFYEIQTSSNLVMQENVPFVSVSQLYYGVNIAWMQPGRCMEAGIKHTLFS